MMRKKTETQAVKTTMYYKIVMANNNICVVVYQIWKKNKSGMVPLSPHIDLQVDGKQ